MHVISISRSDLTNVRLFVMSDRDFKLMLGVLERTQGDYLRTLSHSLAQGLDGSASTSFQSVSARCIDVQDARLLQLPKGPELAAYLLLTVQSRR